MSRLTTYRDGSSGRHAVPPALLGWAIGIPASIAATLVVLAGSDLPPPPGFITVVLIATGLGIAVRVAVPWILGIRDRARVAAALRAATIAAALAGAALAVVVVLIGPGEPSAPRPGAGAAITLIGVFLALGGATGAALAALALVADRQPTRRRALLVAMTPALLVSLMASAVVFARIWQ